MATATEGADVRLPDALPLTLEAIPSVALLEAASLPRRSSCKTVSRGQLSLF